MYVVNIDNKIKWAIDPGCKFQFTEIYREILNNHDIIQTYNNDWNLYFPCAYDETHEEINKIKKLRLKPNINKKIFIIPNSDELASKNDMWLNIVKYHGINKAMVMCPNTWVLYDVGNIEKFKKDYDPNKIYIMKKNIQRQEGLKITKNKDEIINGFKDGYVVVQELLQDPYTINGRKINLRIYVLVICQNKKLNAYAYKNGFMYYTKVPYVNNSMDFWANVTTGYVDRVVYEENPLTHDNFRDYLYDLGVDGDNVFGGIYDLIRDVIVSFEDKLAIENELSGFTTFQLFGIDIGLDKNLKPKLIECNKGPNLIPNDDKDKALKTSLVTDTFKVVGIIRDDGNNFEKLI